MSLMRGWIAQHIERSLEEALVWLKSMHVEDKNVDKSHNRFSYEQEKLTIKLEKPGLIQLISTGCSRARDSIQFMTVSDDITEIGAIFQQDFLIETPTGLYLYIPAFKLKGKQRTSPSARAMDIGGTINSTLLTIKALLNPNDCDNNFHSTLEPGSQNSLPFSHSATFATQITNRIAEPRKERNDISGVQAPDVLRLLQRNQKAAAQITNTSPKLSETEQPFESANITSVTRPLSLKPSSAATNSKKVNQAGNTIEAHIPQLSPERSIDKQEIGSDSILRNRKSSANNAKLKTIGSATANRHHNRQIKEIYLFQENLTSIPRSYERISKEQMNNLEREEAWFSSSDNHASIPPKILEAQLKFHQKRLAAQVSAFPKNLLQNTESLIMDQDPEDAEAEDSEDGDDNHHGDHISKDSHKVAEEVPYTHELPHPQMTIENDEGHQPDSGTNDASECSWPPSPEAHLKPRQVIGENYASDPILAQDHLMPQHIPAIENGVGITSPIDSNESNSDPFRKRMVSSPPIPTVTQGEGTSAIMMKVPTELTLNPTSSLSDDEEMELEVPHVLGDEVQSSNPPVNEFPRISQPSLPGTARHKSAVQVEKTPRQRKRPNEELSSDIIIPGTYTSSQNKPDKDNLYIRKSGIFSSPRPPNLPEQLIETFDETSQNKHGRSNSKLQDPCDPQISKSNNDIIHQSISRAHPHLSLQIPNLDGTSDVPTSPVQAPDVLRLLQRNQKAAAQITNTSPKLSETEQPFESANITSVTRPLSLKPSSAATNSKKVNQAGNTIEAHIPQLSPERSIDKQEIGSDSILRNRKSSANNAKLKTIGSATANRHHNRQIKEIYLFQENLTSIPRSYERISKEQMNNLEREEAWFSSSDNHASIPPKILEAQLKFHQKRLAAQVSAFPKNLLQNTESLIMDQDPEDAEAEDSEDGDDNHHGDHISKDSHKVAEEVPYTHELPHPQMTIENDEGHQPDSGTNDASECSWPPSPEAHLKPRQVIGENYASDPILAQDHLMPQHIPAIENGVGITSPIDSNESNSDPFRKRMVSSPPIPTVTQGEGTSAIMMKVPTELTLNPTSSLSDDEEMELEVPHVLGDEVQSSNPPVNEFPRISQPSLPGTARHKSAVQVEKTPRQRKRPNEELSSDIIIPGTYTSSQNKPDKDNLYIRKSGIFSSPRPPNLPEQLIETFDETSQNKHGRSNSKLQDPCDPQISKSNNDIIHQSISRAHPHLSLQIPNLDGTSDVPTSPGRSSSMNSSPPSRISPEQKYNKGRSAKRRRIIDPYALGFSQEETPYIDSHELARAIRREALQNLPRLDDSQMVDDNTEKGLQSLAPPDDSRIVDHSIEKGLPSTVISEHISTSHNNRPPGQLTSPIMISNDCDMVMKPILPNGTQPCLGQVHQSEQQRTSLFDEYCKTYSQYNGSKKQFIQALVYLEWLGISRQPPDSLWDDIVRCYAQEFSEHLRTGTSRMTLIQFYKDFRILDFDFLHPTPAGRIVTQESLKAALSPESTDQDLIEDSRGKFKGAARLSLQQSTIPRSNKSRPVEQPSSEQINIADVEDTLLSNDSEQLENATPQRSFESADQLPSLSNANSTPMRQENGRKLPRTESPASRSNSTETLGIAMAPLRASKEPEKVTSRRFFETSSQLPLSSKLGSLPRRSLPATQKPSLPTISPKMPNSSPSMERRPRERPSKSSLERSISPSPSRRKSMVASNKPEKVANWLKTQEQPMEVDKSTKLPSTAPLFKGKWDFGKYLAQKRRERSNRPSRSTPKTSFSLKHRSSSGSTGSPV
ncbi:hypothetical protein NHQ30_011111 [Ciborinia camelliae]|nr:hypothetical protein NHQ30_011111 [Ciborinia camelliae]